MDPETDAEQERHRLWREKFDIDDFEHKVTIGKKDAYVDTRAVRTPNHVEGRKYKAIEKAKLSLARV